MSQVKKLQVGGKFIIDGQEINGTDAINAVRSNLGETTGGIMRALQDGATVKYNSADNSISIVGNNGSAQTLNYLPAGTKAKLTDSKFRRDIGATFHTTTDQFRRDLLKLRGVIVPTAKPVDDAANLTNLRKGSGWFYTKDANGKDIFEEGPLNKDRFAMLNEFRDYIQHYGDFGEEESKKKYNTSGWNADNLRILQNTFASIKDPSARDEYWTGLLGRIKANQLSNVDKETLRLMGFDDSGNNSNIEGVSGNNDSKPTIAADWVGDKDAAERLGIGIRKNDGGYWEIYGDNPYATGTWYNRGLDFLKGTPWETGAIYNGRLYTQGDVFSGKYLDLSTAMSPFISAWRDETADWNTRWNNALNSGVNWYGMDNNIYANAGDPTKRYTQYWTKYFNDNKMSGNYNLIDVSNAFSNIGDKQVVSYIDGTNRNIYGIDEPVYLVRDADGNITKYDNKAALMAGSGLVENGDIYGFAPKDIHMEEYRPIKGSEYAEYGRFGPKGQENTVLVGRDGYLYLSRGDDAKPKRVYDIDRLMAMLRGESFVNKDLDAITLTKGDYRWNLATPFRQKRSQMVANEQQRRAERENPNLNKFQWGGSIQKVRSAAVSNDPSTQKHDYTKAHALDGSDGKLTDAEWMQIGAAVGDLAGVGISFIPGAGNIAGATIGATASTTKFIADIKQDGYQGKDLGNYLANLGLDAATLIPILGTGAKSVKAAKIIKGVGKPLIKFLSITGAAAPVVTAVKKIQSGEKYTSEDLTTAIRGIGAGIIATKSIKDTIGEARLAKSIATKAETSGKEALNAIKTSKVKTADNLDISLDKSIKDIDTFIKNNPTESKAIDSIKKIVTSQNKDVKLTDNEAKQLLEGFGINFNKGKVNWKLGKGFLRRSGNVANYELPETTTARSAFSYAINPWKRADVLGSEAIFGFGKKAGLLNGNITANEVNAAINAPKATLEQQALMRLTAENPQAFGRMFEKRNVFVPVQSNRGWYFGGNRYYRTPIIRRNYAAPNNSAQQVIPFDLNKFTMFGNLERAGEIPSQILSPEYIKLPNIFMHDRLGDLEAFNIRGKITNPISYTNIGIGKVGYSPTNAGVFKQGGKILKGQDGLYLGGSTLTRDLKIPLLYRNNNIASSNLRTLMLNEQNKVVDNAKLSVSNAKETLNPLAQTVVDNSGVQQTYGGDSIRQSYINNNYNNPSINNKEIIKGLNPGDAFKINYPNLDDTLRAVVTAKGIYHDRDLQRDALGELYKRQFQTPQATLARYNFSDIEQGYNESVKPYLESNYVTSDSRDSLAFKLSRAQQLSTLAGQKNAQITQRQTQTDEINRQLKNANEEARINTANTKSQYLTNLNYQNKMLDSVTLNRLFSDVINPFGQQMSQQGRDAYNKTAAMQYQLDVNAAQRIEQTRIDSMLRSTPEATAYNALTDSQKAQYGSLANYIYSINPELYKKITTPSQEYNENMQKAAKSYNSVIGAGIVTRKSGGTINIKNSNKNIRSVQEQIAINGHKAAKRSVDELSKALLSMLKQLQAMK